MKKTDLAYFAGFFDGEGCICIRKRKPVNPENRAWNPIYYLQVSAVNTNEWVVQQLHFSFGGSISTKQRQAPHRRCWVWLICARQAGSFLKAVLPYLHVKKAQAEIALQFQQAILHGVGKGQARQRTRLSEEAVAVREAQKILVSNLNHQQEGK